MISENYDLTDATALAYGDSIHAGFRADAPSVEKADSNGEANVDEVSSEIESSKINDENNSELSDFTLGMESISE